ncbi:MAG TPA: RNA polymerase sigma factor [Candidatus Limnocylindrales bacterium]
MTTTFEDQIPATTVRDAVAGDEASFTRLVGAYHHDLLRVAYVIGGDMDLAEEAAQAAWVVAWRRLADVRDPAAIRSWLVAIAANEARQALRRRRRRSVREIRVETDDDLPAGNVSADVDRVDRVDMANLLAGLASEERTLIAMRYALGMSSEEIGVAVGASAGTVRVRLSRLMGRLRRELVDG